jgi:glutamate carboxypeptidase
VADAARARRDRLVEMLAEITALDAPSGDAEALAAPAAVVFGWLEALGARPSRRATAAGELIDAELDGEGRPVLVLCHYDTVWPRGTAAERPFREEDGIARGPGVVDMRGGIVACLGAAAVLADLGVGRRPVRFLVTPDEETGSEASRAAIADAAAGAALVLVPEPALPDGSLKTSRKGWLLLRVRAHGIAAHAGLEPERGVSAVDELLGALTMLAQLAGDDPATTVNVGLLSAANPANVVADLAAATVDVRFADRSSEERVRGVIANLRPRDKRARIEVEEPHSRPPLVRTAAIAAAAARARDRAASLGLQLGEGSAGGVSDANLAALAEVPVLDGIGPVGGGAHALDEWVDLDSLVDRTALIALLLADDEL